MKKGKNFKSVAIKTETRDKLHRYCEEHGKLMYLVADKAIEEYLNKFEEVNYKGEKDENHK